MPCVGQRRANGFERADARIGIGDYGEAQELCQDVFIQAMKKIRQLR